MTDEIITDDEIPLSPKPKDLDPLKPLVYPVPNFAYANIDGNSHETIRSTILLIMANESKSAAITKCLFFKGPIFVVLRLLRSLRIVSKLITYYTT